MDVLEQDRCEQHRNVPTKVKMAENKRLRAEARDARKAERALMMLNKPQKRKYTRREKTAANTLLTL